MALDKEKGTGFAGSFYYIILVEIIAKQKAAVKGAGPVLLLCRTVWFFVFTVKRGVWQKRLYLAEGAEA